VSQPLLWAQRQHVAHLGAIDVRNGRDQIGVILRNLPQYWPRHRVSQGRFADRLEPVSKVGGLVS